MPKSRGRHFLETDIQDIVSISAGQMGCVNVTTRGLGDCTTPSWYKDWLYGPSERFDPRSGIYGHPAYVRLLDGHTGPIRAYAVPSCSGERVSVETAAGERIGHMCTQPAGFGELTHCQEKVLYLYARLCEALRESDI